MFSFFLSTVTLQLLLFENFQASVGPSFCLSSSEQDESGTALEPLPDKVFVDFWAHTGAVEGEALLFMAPSRGRDWPRRDIIMCGAWHG